MCELFQECRRGNILIGTLRLDKDVRFKRSEVIIKYTNGRCCSKNIYIYCSPSHTHTHPHTHSQTQPPALAFPFHFICLFLARGEKENLISIRLNCGGQHYQFKRPGDLTAPTPRWLITSQLWWAILFPLSLTLVKRRRWWWWWWWGAGCGGVWGGGGGGCGGGPRTISAALITGLAGKRAQVTSGYSKPITPSASQGARRGLQDTSLCLLFSGW